jgi:large subunit ribosomal protein L9
MQVILTEDVQHLGKAGELVKVKPGFARNYLLPKRLAVSATDRNRKRVEHERAVIQKRVAIERASAQEIVDKLNLITLQFERLVGDDDRLFGSVTTKEIAEQLKVAGVDIDHRRISLGEPVRALGKYEVPVRVTTGMIATLKFWVVGKEK